MAKQYGEKLKILFLRDYLLKYSDENHTVTVQDMLNYLSGRDLPAERKSIYRDLKALGRIAVRVVTLYVLTSCLAIGVGYLTDQIFPIFAIFRMTAYVKRDIAILIGLKDCLDH